MNFIIAQMVGVLTAIVAFGSVQFKDERIILMGQFLSNVLSAVNFALLGGLSGAWICLLASVQTLLIFGINKKNGAKKQTYKKVVSAIFGLAYIVGTVLTYQRWVDGIVCICAILFTISIIQENSGKMRSVMFCNMSLWVIYDVVIGAYTNILTHGLTLISIVTAKLRLDKKTEKEK